MDWKLACKATILPPHEQSRESSNKEKLEEKSLILFDLGGVIINLDWQRSFDAVSVLFGVEAADLQVMIKNNAWFQELEVGRVDKVQFYKGIKSELNRDFSIQDLDHAFNLMLLDIPYSRIKVVEQLKAFGKNVACLSNTNVFHMEKFDEILSSSSDYDRISDLMDYTFLSHEIGFRKPQKEAFLRVCEEAQTSPDQILFFDDIEENIDAATALGIESIQVKDKSIDQLLKF